LRGTFVVPISESWKRGAKNRQSPDLFFSGARSIPNRIPGPQLSIDQHSACLPCVLYCQESWLSVCSTKIIEEDKSFWTSSRFFPFPSNSTVAKYHNAKRLSEVLSWGRCLFGWDEIFHIFRIRGTFVEPLGIDSYLGTEENSVTQCLERSSQTSRILVQSEQNKIIISQLHDPKPECQSWWFARIFTAHEWWKIRCMSE